MKDITLQTLQANANLYLLGYASEQLNQPMKTMTQQVLEYMIIGGNQLHICLIKFNQ